MKRILLFLAISFFGKAAAFSQQIVYSEKINKDRSNEIVFEIIGKYNNHFLVYKNIGLTHYLTDYNYDMTVGKNTKLSFVPDRTMNVDFIPYKTHFYMIYQYPKKGVVHCVGVKFDSSGKRITEPADFDTTSTGLGEQRIYTTVMSEDKQKILVYKLHRKEGKYSLVTMLFDNELKLIKKSRIMVDMDERRKIYSDISVDNDGGLVFTESTKSAGREFIKHVSVYTKEAMADSFTSAKVDLNDKYIDEINIKVDNVNRNYLFNTFYYKNSRGNVQGLASFIYNKDNRVLQPGSFIEFDEKLRHEAKREGMDKFAFDDFFVRNIILKKDGGFILTAEDYSSQSRGLNNWNRWDYLFNSPVYNNYYYFNYPGYYNYYRPFGTFPSNQSIRYYYDNILVISVDKAKGFQWGTVIEKEQFDDDNDNFLSYSSMVNGGQVLFFFNDNKNNQIINVQSLNSKGEITRNPTLKSQEKGYQFMSRYAKQTGAGEMIIPCNYRGYICFARVNL